MSKESLVPQEFNQLIETTFGFRFRANKLNIEILEFFHRIFLSFLCIIKIGWGNSKILRKTLKFGIPDYFTNTNGWDICKKCFEQLR